MLIGYLSLVVSQTDFLERFVSTVDVHRCAPDSSKYVLNVKVSMEEEAMIDLADYMGYDAFAPGTLGVAAENYFHTIFSEINDKLTHYGVEIRGNFASLALEEFHIAYPRHECRKQEAIDIFTENTVSEFIEKMPAGVGNHIVVFFCDLDPDRQYNLARAQKVKSCGHVLGIMYHNPDNMASVIMENLLKMISNNENIDNMHFDDFNPDLCNYTKSCISEIDSVIGEYASTWRHVHEVTSADFYLDYTQPEAIEFIHE